MGGDDDVPSYELECTGSDAGGNAEDQHPKTKRHHCNRDPEHKQLKKKHRCHCGWEW